MNRSTLLAAVREAERFINTVKALPSPEENHPRETGAIRRSSMDLTRALAVLRRPG